jgi:hypothetical protein
LNGLSFDRGPAFHIFTYNGMDPWLIYDLNDCELITNRRPSGQV